MEKVLTIVIPAYNSQSFLNKVLDSLLNEQTAQGLEVIVVDDGSTDGTAELCREYCKNWPDTVSLISQPNKGHGGALNTGIAAARGKYVKVIDSDDWVETENLPLFMSKLQKFSCDVVLTHFSSININDHAVTLWKSYPESFDRAYTLDEIVENWGAFNQVTAFHGITYRTDFYRRMGLQLSEHVFYEDQEYSIIPFCCAETVMPMDLLIYNYRTGDSGQSMSEENQKKNLSHFQTILSRLFQEYRRLPLAEDAPGRNYYCMMVKSLLVSYLIAVMLIGPRRRDGRHRGAEIMQAVQKEMPEVYSRAKAPYWALRVMSVLGISKSSCDALINSHFYNRLCHRYGLKIIENK